MLQLGDNEGTQVRTGGFGRIISNSPLNFNLLTLNCFFGEVPDAYRDVGSRLRLEQEVQWPTKSPGAILNVRSTARRAALAARRVRYDV